MATVRRLADLDTDGKVKASLLPFGTAEDTICEGDDSRLSDERTPKDASVTAVKLSGVTASDVGADPAGTATTAVAAEATTRASADSTLQDNIDAEQSRAEAAEALLAPLASPALTGTPTAPTASSSDDSTQVATTAFVSTAVDAIPADPAAGTAGLRTLGTGAQQAAAGNDSRLSDSRTPTGDAGGDLTGTYPDPTIGTPLALTADDAADIPLAVAGAVGQTADLQQWANSAGTALAKVDAAGNLTGATVAESITGSRLNPELFRNGRLLSGDNTNFSGLTYDGTDTPNTSCKGCASTTSTNVQTTDFIPVDTTGTYQLSAWVKGPTGVSGLYLGLSCYHIDGLEITPSLVCATTGTRTTLAADLEAGDTTAVLTSAVNWSLAAPARYLAVLPGKSVAGAEYPTDSTDGSFTSNVAALDSNGSISGNTVPLAAAWSGDTVAAGTAVEQHQNSTNYVYCGAANVTTTGEWQHFTGTVTGEAFSGSAFRVGTATVRIRLLQNSTGTRKISGVSFTRIA